MEVFVLRRLNYAWAIALFFAPLAGAQVVRFETNAGNFDLELNPTKNPLLQSHVDNLLQYVTSGRYDGVVVNRAAEGFVLQTGTYKVSSLEVPATIEGFLPLEQFAPVVGIPAASVHGLSNTLGTVGLALRSDGLGGIDHNSGTSSFYVNLGNNSFLDYDFTVFAQVSDMTTIDAIMELPRIDLTQYPDFGAFPSHLGFTDVPTLASGDLVVIQRAFVMGDSIGDFNGDGSVDAADYVLWRKNSGTQDEYNTWRANFGNNLSGSGSALIENSNTAVPEPPLLPVLLAAAMMCFVCVERR